VEVKPQDYLAALATYTNLLCKRTWLDLDKNVYWVKHKDIVGYCYAAAERTSHDGSEPVDHKLDEAEVKRLDELREVMVTTLKARWFALH
jgi:hypothetical protein